MEIFKLVFYYWENLVSVTSSEPMAFFIISSPGDLRRRFAKFIANISQRHNEYVLLSMLYCLKTCFTWMMCFWTATIGYLLEEIQIGLNVRFRDQHYAFGLGNLSLTIERRVKGAWPHWTVSSDWDTGTRWIGWLEHARQEKVTAWKVKVVMVKTWSWLYAPKIVILTAFGSQWVT